MILIKYNIENYFWKFSDSKNVVTMKKHILFSLKKPKIFRQISGTVSIGISQPPFIRKRFFRIDVKFSTIAGFCTDRISNSGKETEKIGFYL